jgi:hypothetical protein
VIATEPVAKTALRTPAAAERKARGQKARDRYIEIAAALKAEAGVTQHTEHNKTNGLAWIGHRSHPRPAGTTRRQLYILAHECGHIGLHSTPVVSRRFVAGSRGDVIGTQEEQATTCRGA